MASKTSIDKHEPGMVQRESQTRETAPSHVRADEPRLARIIGFIGLFLVAIGSAAVLVQLSNRSSRLVGPNLGAFFLVCGLACMLFHAARDTDAQVRLIYGAFGVLWLIVAILLTAIPINQQRHFLPYGFVGLTLALLFLMPAIRNETEPSYRQWGVYVLGAAGLVLALTAFIGGNISETFLLPYSLLLAILGLAYLWAFVGLEGVSGNTGYQVALAIGILGLVVLLTSLGRTWLPPLFYSWGWIRNRPEPYFVPSGLLLTGLGLLYLVFSIGLCSDNRLIVLTRRELAAFFYSPVAYIVWFAVTLVGWWLFIQFTGELFSAAEGTLMQSRTVPEPIVSRYIISWWAVITMMMIVPVLTMRLLSEEQRTGTLEVLLTAPVSETLVVLSKFIAVYIFFMLVLIPWGLFLVSLRVEGGQPFEYRPLLSFFLALACSGAGFVGMGVFFSSITRNQIAAAILTGVGMVGMTAVFFVKFTLSESNPNSPWIPVLTQGSFIDLWISAMQGALPLRYMVFHVSAAVFWLFLTIKVLESRKWR